MISSRDVALPAEVDRTLKKLVKKLDTADLDGASLPDQHRDIVVVITDLDLIYRAEYADGHIRKLAKSKNAEGGDVRISVASDELIALADGRSSLPMALLFGRIRVDAHARDLLLLRQLF